MNKDALEAYTKLLEIKKHTGINTIEGVAATAEALGFARAMNIFLGPEESLDILERAETRVHQGDAA